MLNASIKPALHCAHAAALVALFALSGPQAYAETPFVNDPEMPAPSSVREGRKWQEQDVRLPAWPRDADLVEIKVDGPADEFRHAIDIRSLTTGSDGVVRYTLVTESTSGARNVSFEGLRCTPKGKYKTYAYGDGSRFSLTGNAEQWIEIDERARDYFRYELWRHYLCVPRLFKPRDQKDQV
ncbi:MAG: CNP1-like family protein, partial [Thiohalocapsa sp.]